MPRRRGARSGFTLIELIMVMLVIGILAVTAIPRLADRSIFESRGFQEENLALLRYAQKAAIAQHRYVCVGFTSSTATLTFGTTSACGADLTGPNGKKPFTVTAASGTGYVTTPADFWFEPSGRPSAGRSFSITGAGSVTVEAETGYVH